MRKIIIFSALLCLTIAMTVPVFAVQYQTKASKTTAVGNPPASGGSSNALASYANNLQAAIKNDCPYASSFLKGYVNVNSQNSPCLNKLSSSNLDKNTIAAVIKHLQESASLGGLGGGCDYHLQCVGFVEGVAIGVNSPLSGGKNASDYANGSPGYTFHSEPSKNIKAGDIPIWKPNHIAVAIADANTTLGDIQVAEANGCGQGSVGTETYPGAAVGGAMYAITYQGFLRKN